MKGLERAGKRARQAPRGPGGKFRILRRDRAHTDLRSCDNNRRSEAQTRPNARSKLELVLSWILPDRCQLTRPRTDSAPPEIVALVEPPEFMLAEGQAGMDCNQNCSIRSATGSRCLPAGSPVKQRPSENIREVRRSGTAVKGFLAIVFHSCEVFSWETVEIQIVLAAASRQ